MKENTIQKKPMRYLKNKFFFFFFLVTNCSIGQWSNVSSQLKDFEGIWKFSPPKKSNDTTFTSIEMIKNRNKLRIFYWHDSKSLSVNHEMFGFVEKNKKLNRLSELVDEGFQLFSYKINPMAPNDSIKYLEGSGRYCLALFNGIAGEEEMAPPDDGDPNYFTFNFNGRENEYYLQIHHLPNRVVQALHKNPVEKSKVEDFLGIHYACIKPTRVIINKQPHQPTKMYLIQNDPVEVVEERDNWLKIKYYPEKNGEWTGKTIEGWIKKTDVE